MASYESVLARRSVRRYKDEALPEPTLAQVREIVTSVEPLVEGNEFQVLMEDVRPGEDLVETLGGYGRIVAPPHYLVPSILGEQYPLEDLGYRVQLITLRLTAMGLGTCYMGSLSRQAEVRARFDLPEEARIGAFLAFGWPAESVGGRLFNSAMRAAAGATNKLAIERIFFEKQFDRPAAPPPEVAPLVEAGRNAASASNAQPWRFLWRDGCLVLFVKRENARYGKGAGVDYRLFDGGICMANVALALRALGGSGRWQMIGDSEPDLVELSDALQPMARLEITGGIRMETK